MEVDTLTNGTNDFKYSYFAMSNTKGLRFVRSLLKTLTTLKIIDKEFNHIVHPKDANKYFLIKKIEEELEKDLDEFVRKKSEVFE